MLMSSSPPASHQGLRVLGWRLLQVLVGAMAAAIVILLPPFRVDLCNESWRAAPAGLLAVAALLTIPIIRFPRTGLVLGTCALVLAAWAAWVLYFGNALGCD